MMARGGDMGHTDLHETWTAEGTHQHPQACSSGGTICRCIQAEVHMDMCRGTQAYTHEGAHRDIPVHAHLQAGTRSRGIA